MVGAIFQTALPCQAGKRLVGPTVAAIWGPTSVRAVWSHPGRARGGRRHWPVGSSHPEVPQQLHFFNSLSRWSNRVWFCLKKNLRIFFASLTTNLEY